MYLSISNIIWGNDNLEQFLELIVNLGCHGIEIAPSIIWEEPINTTQIQRDQFVQLIMDHNLTIPSIHSLLYTRPDLHLFRSEQSRTQLAEYIKALISLSYDLGSKILVFGSPKNRAKGSLDTSEAINIAAEFFFDIAETAKLADVYVCMEPLAPDEADFIISSAEGMELVSKVNHPNFCLHLDSKAMISGKENFSQVISQYITYIKHFHVGDPGLAPPGSISDHHKYIGKALRNNSYQHFVSIEVRRGYGERQAVTASCVNYVKDFYLKSHTST